MTLTFNSSSMRAIVMTHTHTQVQSSVGSEYTLETNGRTDGRTLPTTSNAVGNNTNIAYMQN